MSPQGKRAVVATAIVALLVFAAPAADWVVHRVGAASLASRSVAAVSSPEYESQDLVKLLESAGKVGEGQIPEGFQQELFSLDWVHSLRSSPEQGVVGFLAKGPADQVFSQLRAHMEQSGWSCSSQASPYGATFTKEQGCYRWVFVSCSQLSGQTSVVLQGLTKPKEEL